MNIGLTNIVGAAPNHLPFMNIVLTNIVGTPASNFYYLPGGGRGGGGSEKLKKGGYACYAFKEKLFFSAAIILGKKVILSCLKMNLKISHKLR